MNMQVLPTFAPRVRLSAVAMALRVGAAGIAHSDETCDPAAGGGAFSDSERSTTLGVGFGF